MDLIRSHRGPLVLEVNASPGLEGIERATGLDIAGSIIDHVFASGVSSSLKRNRKPAGKTPKRGTAKPKPKAKAGKGAAKPRATGGRAAKGSSARL